MLSCLEIFVSWTKVELKWLNSAGKTIHSLGFKLRWSFSPSLRYYIFEQVSCWILASFTQWSNTMKWGVGPEVTFHEGGKVGRSDTTPIKFFFSLWKHFEKNLEKLWLEWHNSFLLSCSHEMVTFDPIPHFISLWTSDWL